MSYILEAIRKNERELEKNQFIDYPEDKPVVSKKLWLGIILILNMIVWSALLWPKELLNSPQITITSTIAE